MTTQGHVIPDALPGRTLNGYAFGSVGTGVFSTVPGLVLAYFLTNTLGQGTLAIDKNWHVRPQRQGQRLQTLAGQSGLPQMIQRQQHRGRIGTAATQSAAHGQPLFKVDVSSQSGAGRRLQCPR